MVQCLRYWTVYQRLLVQAPLPPSSHRFALKQGPWILMYIHKNFFIVKKISLSQVQTCCLKYIQFRAVFIVTAEVQIAVLAFFLYPTYLLSSICHILYQFCHFIKVRVTADAIPLDAKLTTPFKHCQSHLFRILSTCCITSITTTVIYH